jgi:amino acid adenylation domain-containing protein
MSDLLHRLAALSPEKRALLKSMMRNAGETKAHGAVIRPRESSGPRTLSFAQERIWVLTQLEPESHFYNAARAYRIRGPLDEGALRGALQALVERHEVLRMRFTMADGVPVQRLTHRALEVPVVDLGDLGPAAREEELERHVTEVVRRPFRLEDELPVRARLLRQGARDYVLLLSAHLLVHDELWSWGIACREIAALYDARLAGLPPPLPRLPIQYADFGDWQRERLPGGELAAQIAYWRGHLAGAPPVLDLPTDRVRPVTQSHRGGRQAFRFGPALAAALSALSRRERVTPFVTLLAAFTTLLHRYSQQDDLVVGIPVAGRPRVETEGLIGPFLNTLALRSDLSGNPSFRALLERVRDVVHDARAHRDLPFERLVQELQPERDLSRNPLFQVMFTIQNVPKMDLRLAGLHVERLEVETEASRFDLTLYFTELDADLEGVWQYATDLFDAATIARMLGHFEVLLRGIAEDPDRRVSELPLLSDAERRRMRAWNDTRQAYQQGATLHQLFETQVERTPDAPALLGAEEPLSYRSLNRRANRLARHLRDLGAGPGVVVAVCLERSAASVAAVLAVLKTGAAYLPLDPEHPPERIAALLADGGVELAVTDEGRRGRLPGALRVVTLDRDEDAVARLSGENLDVAVDAAQPAHVIYTSGSTGAPKGVVGSHRATVNRLVWMWRTYPPRAGEVCAHKTSLAFVDSIHEILGPLLHGIPVVPIASADRGDPARFLRVLSDHGVTRLILVPSLLSALLESVPDLDVRLPRLGLWIVSGEELTPGLAESFRRRMPGRTLANVYGSTEVAGDATWFEVTDGDVGPRVPIGRPLANTRCYVVDRYGNLAPPGVRGELCVAGDGLANGYLDDPALTALRFVPETFSGPPGARMYRTGDLARYRPDGNLEFLGRLDEQVKIRGARVEPAEVVAVLGRHPRVDSSVVIERLDAGGAPRLVAYLTGRPVAPEPGELRRFLLERLPAYMVPEHFVALDSLPRTLSGKIDHARLPEPRRGAPERETPYVAPRHDAERILVDVWKEVLHVDSVGVHDNFFAFGGDSLRAMRVIGRLQSRLGIDLPLRALFAHPTVAELAMTLMDQVLAPPASRAPRE